MKSAVADGEWVQTEKLHTRLFSHALCTHDCVLTPHNGSNRVRSRVIHMSSMFAHERSSSFSCCHSSPLTLPSYPGTPPRLWLLSRHCRIRRPPTRFLRNEAYGSMAIFTPLTGYEPNETDDPDDMEVSAPFFQLSSITSVYDLGNNGAESPYVEIDDEHIRNALASPLYIQERGKCESEANLSLQWRKFVSKCTVNFSKHGETCTKAYV